MGKSSNPSLFSPLLEDSTFSVSSLLSSSALPELSAFSSFGRSASFGAGAEEAEEEAAAEDEGLSPKLMLRSQALNMTASRTAAKRGYLFICRTEKHLHK